MKTEETEEEDVEIMAADPFDKYAEEFNALQDRMLELKGVAITDRAGIQNAIEVLAEVGDKVWSFANSDYWWEWSKLETVDMNAIFDIFSKQLAMLKETEGRDLKTASLALKDCTRLAILFLTFLYEYNSSFADIELNGELLQCVDAGDAVL